MGAETLPYCQSLALSVLLFFIGIRWLFGRRKIGSAKIGRWLVPLVPYGVLLDDFIRLYCSAASR